MPHTKSAAKELRKSKKRRIQNSAYIKKVRSLTKELRKFISEGKKSEAKALIPKVHQALDKAAKGDVIKKNTASRRKSRLTIAVSKIK